MLETVDDGGRLLDSCAMLFSLPAKGSAMDRCEDEGVPATADMFLENAPKAPLWLLCSVQSVLAF